MLDAEPVRFLIRHRCHRARRSHGAGKGASPTGCIDVTGNGDKSLRGLAGMMHKIDRGTAALGDVTKDIQHRINLLVVVLFRVM